VSTIENLSKVAAASKDVVNAAAEKNLGLAEKRKPITQLCGTCVV